MKHITFYFDFISPYAYLAFEKLPEALQGHSYSVTYQPLLFAGLLKHHGQLGPAEISGKREWTYRQVLWLAQRQGTPLQMPKTHPFNPLALLRLAFACAPLSVAGVDATPNRFVCEAIFRHVWQSGLDAADPARLAQLAAQLQPKRDVADANVKEQLKASTQEAINQGLFGVPTFAVDGKLFWGLDALPMLRDYLEQTPWFESPAWDAAAHIAVGQART
jgi:2-hydroxychromene-2-carboxylate isomerase